jgi:ribonuclease G
MNKEMIVSSSGHDTRVAILEDDQVVEIFIERERQRGVVGNIYKGRVSKVLPGMQSSFVDIGLERDAFLYVSEVVNTVEEFERLESGDDEEDGLAAPENPGTADSTEHAEGRDAPPAAGTPDARVERRGRDRDRERDRPEAKIEDLLKEGQEVLVQVVKEPLGT